MFGWLDQVGIKISQLPTKLKLKLKLKLSLAINFHRWVVGSSGNKNISAFN